MKVQLAKDFTAGKTNSTFFKDFPYMSNDEQLALFTFVEGVQNDRPLEGKNKTSWQADNGQDVADSGLYKANNYWHYHCGPYAVDQNQVYQATINLKRNLKGKPSKAVIHYQKLDKDTIRIVAYSPQHIPFPKATALFNPLLWRK